jgi:hypothetical protein
MLGMVISEKQSLSTQLSSLNVWIDSKRLESTSAHGSLMMSRRSKEHNVRKRNVAKVALHPTDKTTVRATVCCSDLSYSSCGIQLLMSVCASARARSRVAVTSCSARKLCLSRTLAYMSQERRI